MRPYLLEHPNPNAPLVVRPGVPLFQAHGHPTRKGGVKSIRFVVLHTAEALDPSLSDGDQTAERVAKYLSTTRRRASAHVVVDSDSEVPLLPDEAVAFHAAGYNTASLGLEIAYRADRWGQDSKREAALVSRAAAVLARWGVIYRIPVRKITRDEVDRGLRGIVSHAELDPKRRTDPGEAFPWSRLFVRIIEISRALGEPLGADPAVEIPPRKDEPGPPPEGPPEEPAERTVKDRVEALQKALARFGVYSGSIDGIPGPKTRAALAAAMLAASRRDKFAPASWYNLQMALDALGAEAGPIDGIPGPRTVAAIRRVLRSLFPE